jgi:LemA protein
MVNIPGKKNWILAIIILSLLVIYFLMAFNKLVRREESVNNNWNNLQSEYQRRMELVPDLVSAVKGSSAYERETLKKLVEARAKAAQGLNVIGKASYENYSRQEKLQGELAMYANQVIGVIEKYPDLKTTQSFIRLQDQLIGTERRVKFSRNDFNKAVQLYNIYVRSFPSSLAANIFGFKIKEGFRADTGTDQAPEINFSK